MCLEKGWREAGVKDLGEVCGNCEMCGTAIRYRHLLEHDEYPARIGVGCCCAEHMTQDYVGPRKREQALKSAYRNWAARRERWPRHRRWRISGGGNPQIYVHDHRVLVFRRHGGWRLKIDFAFVPETYSTMEAAKLAAFDRIWPEPTSRQSATA